MTNKALLEEIAKNATILDYHLKRLKLKPDQLHEIDIDLLSEKLKEMYSLIHQLSTGNIIEDTKLPEEEPVASSQKPVAFEEPAPVPKPEPETSNQKPEVLEEPAPVPLPPSPVTEPEPEPEARSQKPVAFEEPDPVPTPPSPNGNQKPEALEEPAPIPHPLAHEPETAPEPRKTTADLFSGPTTIADSFQAKKDISIAAAVSAPQGVKDLKMVIGINDKFLFINELFQGDPAKYNQAIESFNVSPGPEEADQSMNAYREQYSWADNSEAYHRLKRIVHSKFNA